ncbi:Glyoxalase/Bleomycin resistance protein/Dihydroxybiphenyl dioxygenase [Rhypophila sp. PSN 637]
MDYKAAIHKFSTKPPGYEAARQRENQRRHRARVKSRITDLEAKLEETEARLDEALRRIEELTAEMQRLQSHTTQIPSLQIEQSGASVSPTSSYDSSQGRRGSSSNVTLFVSPQDLAPTNPPELSKNITPVTDTTPHEYNGKEQETGDNPNDDCVTLPPPNPGESTIRCREAYSMLKDRIMPEFDPEIVTEWLKPGFRRAVCPGDGCRVQTHVLHIMSASKSHANPLGHISMGVRDYAVSKAFYTAVLSTIGLKLVYDSEAITNPAPAETEGGVAPVSENKKNKTKTLGYGPDEEHEILNIFEFKEDAAPPGAGFHLAFNAPSRDAVVEFHATSLGFGGRNNGLPGLRRHYGGSYFAAFVVDPDGWRLEVVCQDEVVEDEEGEEEGTS